MLVISIVGGLLGLGLIFFLGITCNRYTIQNFDHAFFTKVNLIIMGISSVLLFVGFKWYTASVNTEDGDILNGIALMAISAIIYICVIIYNIKKTNFLIGLPLTVIQIAIFSAIGFFGIFLFLAFIGLSVVATVLGSQTVETKDGRHITIH